MEIQLGLTIFFSAEEIMFYNQKDLIPEHVMLLDTNEAIYVWIGNLSNRDDQRLSVETVLEYLQTGKLFFK